MLATQIVKSASPLMADLVIRASLQPHPRHQYTDNGRVTVRPVVLNRQALTRVMSHVIGYSFNQIGHIVGLALKIVKWNL
jgi:hypothetical protein